MAQDETGRDGGMQAKTARPTSVGPHHRSRDQEDPSNPGIKPEEGYAAEIARNNAATAAAPGGKAPPVAPTPPQGRVSESPEAAEEPEDPGKAPPVAPTPPQGQ